MASPTDLMLPRLLFKHREFALYLVKDERPRVLTRRRPRVSTHLLGLVMVAGTAAAIAMALGFLPEPAVTDTWWALVPWKLLLLFGYTAAPLLATFYLSYLGWCISQYTDALPGDDWEPTSALPLDVVARAVRDQPNVLGDGTEFRDLRLAPAARNRDLGPLYRQGLIDEKAQEEADRARFAQTMRARQARIDRENQARIDKLARG